MAKDIGEIDKRLKVEKRIQETDVKFYNARQKPFRIYGLCDPTGDGPFKRLPFELADNVNYQVSVLAGNTAGGRVRFRTNSEYVAIRAIMPDVTHFPHMTLTGSSGFDVYINKDGKSIYHRSLTPPIDMTKGYEGLTHFGSREERDIIINFPLYNNLTDLYIGIEETATLSEGDKYRYEKPILFYGSSITQGGCASRPGNSYQGIISRRFATCKRSAPNTGNVTLSLSATIRTKSPFLAPKLFKSDINSSSVKNFLKLAFGSSSTQRTYANPFAPIPLENSTSLSTSFLV